MNAFPEAISTDTTLERKATIKEELLKYCDRDTYATVKLWRFFAGRSDLAI
jgi:hypothetical protein